MRLRAAVLRASSSSCGTAEAGRMLLLCMLLLLEGLRTSRRSAVACSRRERRHALRADTGAGVCASETGKL
jgi:hypothetical protein